MTAQVATEVRRLTLRRLALGRWNAFGVGVGGEAPLGALVYGACAAAAARDAAATGCRALAPAAPMVDAWCGNGPQRSGQLGAVRWRHDGHWLFGAVDVDEAAEGLEALTEAAYRDIFATLAHTGCPHLLRLWNYVPRINADDSGQERYWQFNAGRQRAFIAARRSAFEGAPAACAIGTRDGPLRIRVLAGRTRPVAVENPRQVSAYHYPRSYGPHSPTFSRAALVEAGAGQVALLISGTASIVGHASVHAVDVRAQTHEVLANLRAVIAAAHARGTARFDSALLACTVYVRHAEDVPAIREVFEATLGAQSAAARGAVFVEGDLCRAELLVEIEAHAFAPGEVTG